jgi:hypothetical protein
VFEFVEPAAFEVGAQCGAARVRRHRIEAGDLFGVVPIDKGLDRGDGRVHRARPGQRRQRAGQPTSDAPGRQQAAAVGWRQMSQHQGQMALLGGEVVLGKAAQRGVACDGEHAAVNLHCAGFTSMVAAQIGHGRGGPGQRGRLASAPQRAQREKHAVRCVQQRRHRPQCGDAAQPRGARQHPPQRCKAAGPRHQLAVGTPNMKPRERRRAAQARAQLRLGASRRIDPGAALGARLAPVQRHLARTDRAGTVEVNREGRRSGSGRGRHTRWD